jgi:hypothetical protein
MCAAQGRCDPCHVQNGGAAEIGRRRDTDAVPPLQPAPPTHQLADDVAQEELPTQVRKAHRRGVMARHRRWIENDPIGRAVECTQGSWKHIVDKRGRYIGNSSCFESDMREAVRDPDLIYGAGPTPASGAKDSYVRYSSDPQFEGYLVLVFSGPPAGRVQQVASARHEMSLPRQAAGAVLFGEATPELMTGVRPRLKQTLVTGETHERLEALRRELERP